MSEEKVDVAAMAFHEPSRPVAAWRQVAVPSEHGGWSLTAEPVVLGLVVAWSLVVVELWFDMRSRSRRLVPELAGTVGIGSVVAAIALAGGESAALAVGLWVVIAARATAAILYARTQVFRAYSRPVVRWHSDLAQALAVAAVAVAWSFGAIPFAPLAALGAVALFNVASVRGPVKRAVVIGLQQMTLGIAVIVVTAIAVLT